MRRKLIFAVSAFCVGCIQNSSAAALPINPSPVPGVVAQSQTAAPTSEPRSIYELLGKDTNPQAVTQALSLPAMFNLSLTENYIQALCSGGGVINPYVLTTHIQRSASSSSSEPDTETELSLSADSAEPDALPASSSSSISSTSVAHNATSSSSSSSSSANAEATASVPTMAPVAGRSTSSEPPRHALSHILAPFLPPERQQRLNYILQTLQNTAFSLPSNVILGSQHPLGGLILGTVSLRKYVTECINHLANLIYTPERPATLGVILAHADLFISPIAHLPRTSEYLTDDQSHILTTLAQIILILLKGEGTLPRMQLRFVGEEPRMFVADGLLSTFLFGKKMV